jgi:predicted nucleic acid-binding protein
MECRCLPMRRGDVGLLALYDTFFAGRDLQVGEIDGRVIDAATEIRATFNFKSPDAIHLAAATVAKATTFLTGDQELARFDRIAVEII